MKRYLDMGGGDVEDFAPQSGGDVEDRVGAMWSG